jgi:hypothetical protein
LTIIQEKAMKELRKTRDLINEVAKISTPEERNIIITSKGVKWVKTKIQVIKDVHKKGYFYGIKRLSDETGMAAPESARMICGWLGVGSADGWLDEHDFATKSGAALIKQHCKGVAKRPILTNGGQQEMNVTPIPIGDVCRLTAKSDAPFNQTKKPGAAATPEIALNKLFSIHERTLNFDKWQPKEEDKPCIVAELGDYYINTLKTCGFGEESEEAREIYKKVRDNPILDCKDDVQDFFRDCYDVVQGRINELYPEELVGLINLTVCPK